MENKELIRKVFHLLFESENLDDNVITLYFSTDYVQHVDNETLSIDEFIAHIKKVREKIDSCRITFNTLISENDIVFSNHTVCAIMKNGSSIQQHVLAEFHICNGKIHFCDELTFHQKGDLSESNLGSIR